MSSISNNWISNQNDQINEWNENEREMDGKRENDKFHLDYSNCVKNSCKSSQKCVSRTDSRIFGKKRALSYRNLRENATTKRCDDDDDEDEKNAKIFHFIAVPANRRPFIHPSHPSHPFAGIILSL